MKFFQKKALFALLSALLMVLAFPTYDIYPLLWIGFIPFLVAMEDTTVRESYWLGLITGWAGICGAYPWLSHVTKIYMEAPVPVNYLIWILYGFYHGQLFGLAAALLTWAQKKTALPVIIIFPIIMTGLWTIFPALFFFNLGNGTTGFITALQGIDITGIYGLDYIIVLCSAFIYSIIRYKKIKTPVTVLAGAAIILTAWFSYGIYARHTWQEALTPGETKKIGIVQPNRPSSLFILPPEEGYSTTYPLEMALSKILVGDRPDLIIWPEGNFYGYFEDINVRLAFMKQIRDWGIPLLFHDYPWDMGETGKLYRNSSVLIRDDGTYGGRYDKRFIVPFGEYIPFVNYDWPIIQSLELPPPLTPGKGPVTFHAGGMKIDPLICYETQFSTFVADSLGKDPQGKIITVQSNDGWYGRGAEAAQQNSSIILRAVENRVPVIHVVNNGPSMAAGPDGQVLFTYGFYERGSWIASIPYNEKSGGSFYTRHPAFFVALMRILLIVLIAWVIFRNRITAPRSPGRS